MCSSAHFIRRGKDTKNRVRYSCNACSKNFTGETWEKTATRAIRLALAIKAVLDGSSAGKASRQFHVAEYAIRKSFPPKDENVAD